MRALRSIGALVAVLVVPAAANAYTLRTTDGGRPVRWDDTDVSFRVDRALAHAGAASDVGRTVAEAFTRWGTVPGSPFLFRGEAEPRASCPARPFDGVSDIVLVEEEWAFDSAFAGVTLVTYDVATGDIMDADVLLNGVELDFGVDAATGSFDLGNVLTHELGHLVGLGHSEDHEATMYASSSPGETRKRTLAEDDVAGLQELYGPATDRAAEAATYGCSASPVGRPTSVPLALLLLVLGLWATRAAVGARRAIAAALVGLAVLSGGGHAAWSAVARVLPVAELGRRADVVLRGTVQAREAHWAGSIIVTDVTVTVDDCWAGRCGTTSRVVRELGGEVDGVGMLAPEPSALPLGAEVVVFARDIGGVLLPLGGAQAVFRLDPAAEWAERRLGSRVETRASGVVERLHLSELRAALR